ncbi:Putative aspartic peptidase A1 family, aspartic peptidase, active [Septoria linicola]|uniref:Aspartic peptidase A1 family, aspartic peptidase, active n=1 Tax=Septoria linicola TaxID=215465 RepID=A0A9Q9ENP8_9PEZI|nr:Putative aspartic peptidase A1 family, aspartic peptidase, active [Septoria linicola]
MARMTLFFVLLMAAIAVALPSRNIQKRSFKAPVRGRTPQGPLNDVLRVHQKYGTLDAAAVISTTSRDVPAPFPTSFSTSYGTQPLLSTLTVVSALETIAPASYKPFPNATISSAASVTKDNEDGEVTATPEENEIQYLSPVTVGGQLLNLNFDTGSSDLWVFSSELGPKYIGDHSIFNSSLSDTYEAYDNATWSIQYGDGSYANGIVGFDTVDVGGSTVDKQCIELAVHISPAFVRDPVSDGLLGLGFGSINRVQPTPQKTFFENVMDDLTEPLFTADLEDNMGTGTYEFGAIDTSKFQGDIHYVDVDNSDGWWQFPLPSVKFGNRTMTCNSTCAPAIADTGTSLLYLDSDVVTAYYDQVEDSQVWQMSSYIYPCGAKLPDLSLQIGDHYMTISGDDMTYLEFGGEAEGPAGRCMGGLQAGPAGMQILGDVFLKQVFAVFDGGNLRFGVAEKN